MSVLSELPQAFAQTIDLTLPSIQPVIPELMLVAVILFLLIMDLFVPQERKREVGYYALATIIACFGTTLYLSGGPTVTSFQGTIVLDSFASFFKIGFYLTTAIGIMLSLRSIQQEKSETGEYYLLYLLCLLGMMVAVSSSDLILIFLGLELTVFCFYALVGIIRHDVRSSEAGLKYFVLGSLSTALMLYGISLLYGVTGTTDLHAMNEALAHMHNATENPFVLIGLMVLVAGIAFKVAAAPFHMWVPDAYEGAPTAVTAFIATSGKLVAFAVMIRILVEGLFPLHEVWAPVLIGLAILSMFIGTFVAVVQNNVKRMLAYSAIGHTGFALFGLIAGTELGLQGLLIYLFLYLFMGAGVFGVLVLLRREGVRGEFFDDLKGISTRHPILAMVMTIFALSLAGVPPLAGFWGKFYLFAAMVEAGYIWPVVIGALFSVIMAYYYLKLVVVMYMRPENDADYIEKESLTPAMKFSLLVTAVATIYFGLQPEAIINWSGFSVQGILS